MQRPSKRKKAQLLQTLERYRRKGVSKWNSEVRVDDAPHVYGSTHGISWRMKANLWCLNQQKNVNCWGTGQNYESFTGTTRNQCLYWLMSPAFMVLLLVLGNWRTEISIPCIVIGIKQQMRKGLQEKVCWGQLKRGPRSIILCEWSLRCAKWEGV